MPSPSVPPDAGSSPLTRGKPRTIRPVSSPLRLIPAHAGKTTRRNGSSRRAAAHPRSRGENSRQARRSCRLSGSSPLTRGKLTGPPRVSDEIRLIPAHAGKTARGRRFCPRAAAHPRSRGENLSPSSDDSFATGSSPLTRGKRGQVDNGLSPAGAHPRSRGENARTVKRRGDALGSSPLTRGKRAAIRGSSIA